MSLDNLHAVLLQHVGKRARVTIVNGVGRECVKDTGAIGMWREYPTIGGNLVGGEYDDAVRVEIMQESGRYATVA